MDSIVLMGIKHCGKSSQARILGAQLGLDIYDTDSVIEDCTGKTPRGIYSAEGENAFKAAEVHACEVIREKIASSGKKAAIATGGGICNNPDAVEILKKIGTLVFLCTDEETAVQRIVREITMNPDGTMSNLPAYIAKKNPATVNDVKKIFHAFFEERTELYKKIADVTVRISNAPKKVNTNAIRKALGI